jgi:molybdopterin biosynthesis enzyme
MRAVNRLGEIIIASRVTGFPVKKGDKLCGMRVIPLMIEKEKMEHARRVAGDAPLVQLLPIKSKKYGLVVTGNEVFHKRIPDTFTSVILEKLSEHNCEMIARVVLDDDHEKITDAIKTMLDTGAEMALCTGGMSVDPDDKTPLAIKNAANNVVSYGAPVMPGAMFMLAYTADHRPLCGLPGCVMYSQRTVFDLVLPRLLADVPVTAEWLAGLGNGGLCLNCPECHFPNCAFGKGT